MTDLLDRDAFDAALPAYIAGTCGPAAARGVEDYLRAHPDAAAELHWHATLRTAVRSAPQSIPADLGWDEYAAKMGLAAAPAESRRRLRDLVARAFRATEIRMAPAFAVGVLALVVVQSTALLDLRASRSAPSFASERGEAAAPPLIRVRFKPAATEYEIRKLLLALDARVVDGPSQLGDYGLSVSDDRVAAVQASLAGSPLVEVVSVAPRLGCCNAR